MGVSVRALLGGVVGGLALAACARGRCEEPPRDAPACVARPAEPAVAPPLALPPGCTRLTDGTGARVSDDGRLVAFARWRTILGQRVPPEAREYYGGLGAEPLVPELAVLDVETGVSWAVPGWAPALAGEPVRNGSRLPVGWTPRGSLVLSDGTLLDPRQGTPSSREARPPPEALAGLADGEGAASWAWTADGARVAFLAQRTDVNPTVRGEMRRRGVFVADGTSAPRRVVLRDPATGRPFDDVAERAYLMEAHLAWSSDGARLFLRLEHGGMDDRGPDRFERVACYDVAQARTIACTTYPHLERAPDQRSGCGVWDAAGRRFVYLGAFADAAPDFGRPWVGRLDVCVGDARDGTVRRVTTDGVEKGRPCLDPRGTRVAFLVGTGAGRARRVYDDERTPLRLRVVELDGGGVWEEATAPSVEPDPWVSTLQWTADGTALLYGYGGVEGGIYRQTVPSLAR